MLEKIIWFDVTLNVAVETTAPFREAKFTDDDEVDETDIEDGYEITMLLFDGNFRVEVMVKVAVPIFWTKLLYAFIVNESTVVLVAVYDKVDY